MLISSRTKKGFAKIIAFAATAALLVVVFGFASHSALAADPIKLKNPLSICTDESGNELEGFDCVLNIVKSVLKLIFRIGIPVIVVAIIYTGYLFIAAQGNPKKLEDAKQTLLWVLVGSAIILGAGLIAEAISGTLKSIESAV